MNDKSVSVKGTFDILYKFYGPQGWWPAKTRLEVIVGAILTQNTAWANVEKAIANLRSKNAISSIDSLHRISGAKLASLIRPAGYYNIKSKRLKNFVSFLHRRYGGSLKSLARRNTKDLSGELLNINGIGPETRDSILLYAFERPVFVIDAYTKRIFSRHGLFKEDISYDLAQRFFIGNLPDDKTIFNEFHALIVRLAKDFCKKSPKCAGCPLEGREITCK